MATRTANVNLVENAVLVTPHDTNDIDLTSGIHVNGAGNIKVIFDGGATATLTLLSGISYPYRVTRVFSADTTATGIYALY